MSSPKQYIERLTALATAARHHPEPAVAVALLAQLILDFVIELQPFMDKYALLLRTGGALAVIEELERSLGDTELRLAVTAMPGSQPGTYEDLQANANALGQANQLGQPGFDPGQDTTGTAG